MFNCLLFIDSCKVTWSLVLNYLSVVAPVNNMYVGFSLIIVHAEPTYKSTNWITNNYLIFYPCYNII